MSGAACSARCSLSMAVPNMGEVRKRRRKQPLMISLSLGLSADGFTARPFTVQELPEFWDFPSSWLIVDRSTSFELGKSLNLRSS